MKSIIMTSMALMVCATVSAQTAEPTVQPYENTVQVNGSAEREIAPDEIYVRIVISENDTKGRTSIDQMEQDMIRVLTAAGINVEDALKVGDMSASMYKRTFGGRSGRTTATYELKVGGADMLATVYQDLAAAGIYNLSITRVAHSRIREITDELRVEAVRNAQKVARDVAQALGQGIGRAVSIVDYNPGQPVYARSAVMEYAMPDNITAAGVQVPQLEFRNIKLNYSVTVKFVLE